MAGRLHGKTIASFLLKAPVGTLDNRLYAVLCVAAFLPRPEAAQGHEHHRSANEGCRGRLSSTITRTTFSTATVDALRTESSDGELTQMRSQLSAAGRE